MFSYSNFPHECNKSQVPIELLRSADYKVLVGGEEIPVYTCRISAYPFNTWWPGHQRPINQSEVVSYINLVADEAVTLEVEPLTKSANGKIMIKPYSKGIEPSTVDGKIAFTISENGAYVLEIDDYHGLLYIFHNKPRPCEDPSRVTHYFGRGVHVPGKIVLHSGESVYVDKDALVYGCIYAENAENIHIWGNGILDDSREERESENCTGSCVNGNLKFYDCKNLCIEGVGVVNSAIWCVNLFHCFDVLIDGINVFGQWRYNTDGIDIVNSARVTVRNSFVHSFDDTVVIKGIDKYAWESNRDILIEHCVLWCDWGRTCEIGLETAAPEYANILFRDCDLLRAGSVACDIQNGDSAEVHDITFEDIRIELESFYTKSQMQRTEDQCYDLSAASVEIAKILCIQNKRFREIYAFLNLGEEKSTLQPGDPRYASVSNVTVKDIAVYCDPALIEKFGKSCTALSILNIIPTTTYQNIRVENLTLNGKRLCEEDLKITLEGVAPDVLTVK